MREFKISLDKWYALAVKAGNENATKRRILERLEKSGHNIPGLEIICPEQEVTVQNNKEGNKRKRKMMMPGYMLLRCRQMNEDDINLIARVKGVMQFMGGNDSPTQLPLIEVRRMLDDIPDNSYEKVSGVKAILYEVGETVEVMDGPLQGFEATITEYNEDSGSVSINVEIFGRETLAKLTTGQIKKV